MHKRVTTNVKIDAIIHAKNDDAETEALLQLQEKMAKMRLRKACLYGGGARTKLPKTKKTKKSSKSPFQLPGGIPEELPSPKLGSSVPPGAHDEQFRMVQ